MSASTEGAFGNASEAHARSQGGQRQTGRSFAEQSSRVVDEAQELGRVALAGAGEVATNLRDKGRDALESGRDKAVEAKHSFDRFVGDNPMKSVLIAAGVGAVLGFALSRRSS